VARGIGQRVEVQEGADRRETLRGATSPPDGWHVDRDIVAVGLVTVGDEELRMVERRRFRTRARTSVAADQRHLEASVADRDGCLRVEVVPAELERSWVVSSCSAT